LYFSTNGIQWNWLNDGVPWNFSAANANPCVDNWEGVNCSVIADQYHVTELKLTLHELNGQIPESLGNLGKNCTVTLSKITAVAQFRLNLFLQFSSEGWIYHGMEI